MHQGYRRDGQQIKSYLTKIRKVDIKELIHSKSVLCVRGDMEWEEDIGIWFEARAEAAEKRKRLLACMAILGFLVFLATHAKLILISGNVLIGFTFMIGAFRMLRRTSAKQKRGFKKTALSAGWLLVFALGCVSLVTPEKVFAEKMIFIGSCFVLYGVWNYLKVIFDEKVK